MLLRAARRLSVAATIAAISSLIGCSSSSAPSPDAGPSCAAYFGDPSSPAELSLVSLDDYGSEAPVADGGHVAMLFPPQGGRVVFVGVRAKNVDGCGVTLTGALRDPATMQVRVDQRTVNLRAADDGFGQSGGIADGGTADISSYANIPVCPNQWASTDLPNHDFTLEVTIQDRKGKKATASVRVVPECGGNGPNDCACICAHGYVLGQPCNAGDASTGDATASDATGD